jgi:O-antigen/teichoic acid export membrane protein
MVFITAIGSRYFALAVQFILIILVAQNLPQSDAGIYLAIFGAVSTFFCLAGVGLPDGLVIYVGQEIASAKWSIARTAIRSSFLWSVLTSIIIFGSICLVAWIMGLPDHLCFYLFIWTFLYGLTFTAAQGLIAVRKTSLGSFFFYSATNLISVFTTIPYLTLSTAPQIEQLLQISIFAAALSATAATGTVLILTGRYKGNDKATFRSAIGPGVSIAISRLVNAAIYWVPVWVAGLLLTSTDAAIMATAGRLLIGVTAVIAAVRFSVRPSIVAAAQAEDWLGIEAQGQRIALATTTLTLVALAVCLAVGRPVLQIFFPPEYALSWSVLTILLIGALAESAGGVVDEILKMTGHSIFVLIALFSVVVFETILCLAASKFGLLGIASAQSLSFLLYYSLLIGYLFKKKGIIILPIIKIRKVI